MNHSVHTITPPFLVTPGAGADKPLQSEADQWPLGVAQAVAWWHKHGTGVMCTSEVWKKVAPNIWLDMSSRK